MYDWDFSVIFGHWPALLSGLWITVLLTALSVVLGSAFGTLFGLTRHFAPQPVKSLAIIYIEGFLAIPVLVLLIWLYYCLPIVVGVTLSSFWTAVFALSLSLSAYCAEVLRGGLLAVPEGQLEAARALNMSRLQTIRHIVLPQAIRVSTPPLLTLYVSTLKLSSLASVIAVYELLHSAEGIISQTFRPLEVYTTVAVLYIATVLPLIIVTRRMEGQVKWRLT